MCSKMVIILTCLVITTFISCGATLTEGEDCQTENLNGKCLNIYNCSYAVDLVRRNKTPQQCGFKDQVPIVCCPTTSSGKKSADKCREYHFRDDYRLLVYQGKPAQPREFPHMAILGYGGKNNIQWFCGGTLISEQFILTAAHCLNSRDFGKVTRVRLGELDIKTTTDDANPQDYDIAETFAHPGFKPPSHYNDIALIKLERIVEFNNWTSPACLYTGRDVPFRKLIATGWGKTDFYGESSSRLLKVDLDHISHQKCAKSYADVSPTKLKNGIVDDIQICAGGKDGRDSCPGDSGGPLQVKNEATSETLSHYSVVGVTSFGKACGAENSVGVYTRVAPFTEWIENIVWP